MIKGPPNAGNEPVRRGDEDWSRKSCFSFPLYPRDVHDIAKDDKLGWISQIMERLSPKVARCFILTRQERRAVIVRSKVAGDFIISVLR